MANKVTLTSHFESCFKRRARKFMLLESEMDELIQELETTTGIDESLGAGLYKDPVSQQE